MHDSAINLWKDFTDLVRLELRIKFNKEKTVQPGLISKILEAAKLKHPERWTGPVQDCTLDRVVWLNPTKEKCEQEIC